jgi:hypothetical protein
MGVSDGTYIRALAGDSAGNVYINPAAPFPGDDAANDRKKVYGVGHDVYEPTSAAAVLVNASETIVLAWTKVLNYEYVEAWVKNVGGGASGSGPFTNVKVYISSDGTDANQQDVTALQDAVEVISQTATVGQSRLALSFGISPSWIKLTATAAAAVNDTMAQGWVVCRK